MGDVGSVVLRDRKHLAQDGMIVVVASLSGQTGDLVSGPDIITRGFVYVKESESLMEELREVAADTLDDCQYRNISDWATIKSAIKSELSRYLYKKTKRNPMILPVIMEQGDAHLVGGLHLELVHGRPGLGDHDLAVGRLAAVARHNRFLLFFFLVVWETPG